MKELKNLNSLNNKKLLVVLPVNNKFNDVYLNECAYSLSHQTYPIDIVVLMNGVDSEKETIIKEILDSPKILVTTKGANGQSEDKYVVAEKKLNYVIEKTDSYTFPSIFNEAFNYASVNSYEWFSVVETEDILDAQWYSTFAKFAEKRTEYHGFFPLTREVTNGQFLGFFNEACWSEGLGVEVAGVFDLQLLMRYNCMNATGAVIKTESIKEYSQNIEGVYKPMKESVKVSYMYEFFLRMIYNDLKFYTIPRLGYEHRLDNSNKAVDPFSSKVPKDLMARTPENGGMTLEEYKWWSDFAKKEYFFDEDRKLEYVVAQTK
jgi:hypothetical protein